MPDTYSYCFIREDLSREQQLVQVGHACMKNGAHFRRWEGNLIVIGVKSEEHLFKTCSYLERKGIQFVTFREPDINLQVTSVCTIPIGDPQQLSAMRKFQLIKASQ